MTELYDDCNFKNKTRLSWVEQMQQIMEVERKKAEEAFIWGGKKYLNSHGPISDAKLSVSGDLEGPKMKLPSFDSLNGSQHQFPAFICHKNRRGGSSIFYNIDYLKTMYQITAQNEIKQSPLPKP